MLELEVTTEGINIYIKVRGELDIASVGEFDTACSQILNSGSGFIMIDFAHLDFIDSTGVRSLMTVIKGAWQNQVDVKVINTKPMVFDVLETTGVVQLFGADVIEKGKE